MTTKITDLGNYKRISYTERKGKCSVCAAHVDVQIRVYVVDGQEVTKRVRTACDCGGYRTDREV
jgi:predicted secreted Zn-dependent protease